MFSFDGMISEVTVLHFPIYNFYSCCSSLLLSTSTVYSCYIVTSHCTSWFAIVSGDHKASVENGRHTACCDGVQDIAVLFRYSSACPESIHALCNRGAVPPSATPNRSLPQWKYHGGTISNRSAGLALRTLILPLVWLTDWCTLHWQACRVPMKYNDMLCLKIWGSHSSVSGHSHLLGCWHCVGGTVFPGPSKGCCCAFIVRVCAV